MSSLKATHTAHRIASEILGTPTPELQAVVDKARRNPIQPIPLRPWRPLLRARLKQQFLRAPTWGELVALLLLWGGLVFIAWGLRSGYLSF